MAFVTLDGDGKVTNYCARGVPTYGKPADDPGWVKVQDDDPRVIAFNERTPEAPAPISAEELIAVAEKKGRMPTKDEVLAERAQRADARIR